MIPLEIDFPRAKLAHLPTPLEPMPRLAAALGLQAPLLVKRDDCTGLATGGNKVRQLEYYLGDALEKSATRILITGAVQSNYVRTAAAAAAKTGLACSVQLEERVKGVDDLYRESGNVLLDRLLGADIHHFPEGEDEAGADAALEALATQARSAGEVPYVIHLSETPRPLGALGYVAAAEELLNQSADSIGTVVVASGSGVTHAGLLVGLRACGRKDIRVIGACVRRDAIAQHARILRVSRQVEKLLGREGLVSEQDVEVTDAVLGKGYGKVHASTREALTMAATMEGLILDPVYSAKTLAAAIAFARSERPTNGVVFVHTGGLPAVFAYGDRLFEEEA
ncbi:MAG: D-cysteine desulfhydrase family protein [Chromatiales bacterium]|jgi:D-cysteine desulfhydrase family pyridoxal phosphate-dependent enzyme|nr:D-cysteine desulfhydrase family protein [Chromatiales bacterium]